MNDSTAAYVHKDTNVLGFYKKHVITVYTTESKVVELSERVMDLLEVHDIEFNVILVSERKRIPVLDRMIRTHVEKAVPPKLLVWNPRDFMKYINSSSVASEVINVYGETDEEKPFWVSDLKQNGSVEVASVSRVLYKAGDRKCTDFILHQRVKEDWGIDFSTDENLTDIDMAALGVFYTYLMDI